MRGGLRAVHGIYYAALRYSNVYGPRQDPHGEARVVAIICGNLAAGKASAINGTGVQPHATRAPAERGDACQDVRTESRGALSSLNCS